MTEEEIREPVNLIYLFFFLAELLSDTLAVVMGRKGPCYQNRQGALAFVGTWVLHLDFCSPFSLRKQTLKRDFI